MLAELSVCLCADLYTPIGHLLVGCQPCEAWLSGPGCSRHPVVLEVCRHPGRPYTSARHQPAMPDLFHTLQTKAAIASAALPQTTFARPPAPTLATPPQPFSTLSSATQPRTSFATSTLSPTP